MSKKLFMFGPADGLMLHVEHEDRYFKYGRFGPMRGTTRVAEFSEYERCVMHFGRVQLDIFVLAGTPPEDVVSELIKRAAKPTDGPVKL